MSSLTASVESMSSTFVASVRSVGTAVTMAALGVYLHRRGFVGTDGKRALALISQQVTFPLFLFTKILYCNQNWSTAPCPDVTRSLQDVWMLLFWPLYVVGIGLLVGYSVARATGTPPSKIRSVLAACAFGNSTGLPITLLSVVHANFPETSDLGRIDPTLFLSVYLLLYPVLQWGLGGWILASQPQTDEIVDAELGGPEKSHSYRNVLNNQEKGNYYKRHRKGLSSADEGMYMTEIDLPKLLQQQEGCETDSLLHPTGPSIEENRSKKTIQDYSYQLSTKVPDTVRSLMSKSSPPVSGTVVENESEPLWSTIRNVLDRCFQPPVIGAMLGIFFAVTPIRGIFVDIVDRDSSATLQWFFDGLYAVGLAAVPINMIILGCNLSASYSTEQKQYPDDELKDDYRKLLSKKTMIGIVIGKMVVMPLVGICSAVFLKNFVWDIPDDIDGAFYLVLMIVFVTPTANNVMVMVELSGSGAKEGIARAIALQYAVAPLILSATMTVAIGVASSWS